MKKFLVPLLLAAHAFAAAADPFLRPLYDSLHDTPAQRRFRALAPIPAGVVYIQQPGEGAADEPVIRDPVLGAGVTRRRPDNPGGAGFAEHDLDGPELGDDDPATLLLHGVRPDPARVEPERRSTRVGLERDPVQPPRYHGGHLNGAAWRNR